MIYPFENKEKELLELIEKQLVEMYGTSISIPFYDRRILDIKKDSSVYIRSSVTNHPIGVDKFSDYNLQEVLEIIKNLPDIKECDQNTNEGTYPLLKKYRWNMCKYSHPLSNKRREGFDGAISEDILIRTENEEIFIGFYNTFKMGGFDFKYWFKNDSSCIENAVSWTNIDK